MTTNPEQYLSTYFYLIPSCFTLFCTCPHRLAIIITAEWMDGVEHQAPALFLRFILPVHCSSCLSCCYPCFARELLSTKRPPSSNNDATAANFSILHSSLGDTRRVEEGRRSGARGNKNEIIIIVFRSFLSRWPWTRKQLKRSYRTRMPRAPYTRSMQIDGSKAAAVAVAASEQV